MRLGQLARKLALSPTEIINFLTANNVQLKEGSNTKLTEDLVKTVIQQLAPDFKEELPSELNDQKNDETVVPEVIAVQEPASEPLSTEVAEIPSSDSSNEEIKVEVIKAPKVELAGLKVLGKIDLPQPKKKEPVNPEPVSEETTSSEPEKQRRERRKPYPNKQDRNDFTDRKNPIALQREREAREAEKKRQAQAKLEKERRTQHYLQKVKASVPTKPAKIIDEHVVEMEQDQSGKTPKTWLGKFWKWYTS